MRKNHPVILMVDGKVREVGRIDIGPDWKFEGWISTSVADALDLEKNLGSVALNPHDDYIATDTTGVIVEPSEEYFDDNTMGKIRKALTERHFLTTYGEEASDEIINALKDAGILFRERKN